MMAPVLRIKYHVDPSSLSCILESFLGHIYSKNAFHTSFISSDRFCLFLACEGRFVHPHELKLLSDDNNRFVFYAVMIDVRVNDEEIWKE